MGPTDATAEDLAVRLATGDEAAEVAVVLVATRRAAVPEMPPLEADETRAEEFLLGHIERGDLWVAVLDGIVGFAIIEPGWLHSLYVAPDHQGSGVGTTLLELAKGMRPQGFGLWVFAANERARGFYRRHGLIELEHTDGSDNQERQPDVRMDWPGEEPLARFRSQIDEVDDQMALLLARRFALTVAIQGYKEHGGHQGRDAQREQVIAERMAARAPGLDPDRVARVLDVVVSEGLDQWETR